MQPSASSSSPTRIGAESGGGTRLAGAEPLRPPRLTPQMTEGLPPPRRYFAIGAVSFGTALVVIDGAIPSVALPTLARDLQVSGSEAVLVVTVYQLVLVMTLLPFSALGDRLGHRRLYQLGQLVFTI